jgi:hypothetical protein
MSYIIFQNPFGSISGSLRQTVGRSINGSIGKSTDLKVSWVVVGQTVMNLERVLG